MIRRALLVVALLVALAGGFSGADAARRSCDVIEIGIGNLVISTEPLCVLPCINGQPLCGESTSVSGATSTVSAVPGAGR